MTAPKPERPSHLPHGRWLGDFPDLSDAEEALVAACAKGERWKPEGWDVKRPEAATATNTIRAELIRFLLLGGDADHPVHEDGVMPRGAWITGELDLHQAQARVRFGAGQCRFAAAPVFAKASLPELALQDCQCPGLIADGLKVAGSLFLNDGFRATGETRLLGAVIGGALTCTGGRS